MNNTKEFSVNGTGDATFVVYTQHSLHCTPAHLEKWQEYSNQQPWVSALNITYAEFLGNETNTVLLLAKEDHPEEVIGSVVISDNGTELYLTGEVNWQEPKNPNIPVDIATAALNAAKEISKATGRTRVSCVTFASPEDHGTLEALHAHPDFYFTGVDGRSPAKKAVMAYRYRSNAVDSCLPEEINTELARMEKHFVLKCLG